MKKTMTFKLAFIILSCVIFTPAEQGVKRQYGLPYNAEHSSITPCSPTTCRCACAVGIHKEDKRQNGETVMFLGFGTYKSVK